MSIFKSKKKFYSLIFILAVVLIGFGLYQEMIVLRTEPKFLPKDKIMRKFTEKELAMYNGENKSLPILLAFDNYVYDVTSGREYYQPGGVYHRLAGKDSTSELKVFGGNMIKEKYPVIGILVSTTTSK